MNAISTQFPELPTPAAVLERTWRATWFVGESKLDHGIEQHAVYTADQVHQYARDYAAALSQTAGVPSWIVNDLGELGVMVDGVPYFLYKGDNIVYEDAKHDDGSPMLYRMVGKREFGEVCHPRHWEENGWAATHRYTQELVYTPGLSFGKPKDGDWRPLPAKVAAPAASGVHPDALPDGTLSKSTAKRVEALTQQRVAEWSDDLRAVLDAASEASQVPLMWLANQDFSPEQTKAWLCEAVDATVEEGAFSGSLHQVAEEGTGHVVAFTGCGPKSAANAKFLIWCVHFILKHRDALATTPQPSADAVRELVKRWRGSGKDWYSNDFDIRGSERRKCADELESLLSAASGEKGVGNG